MECLGSDGHFGSDDLPHPGPYSETKATFTYKITDVGSKRDLAEGDDFTLVTDVVTVNPDSTANQQYIYAINAMKIQFSRTKDYGY
jgi:hypothetical protein